ncbi:hypothetical protein CCL24_00820 [Pseudomonas congelans]|nr:hypothetical protein CCL24_00820 [Pseudomonas congelans]
MVFGDVDIEYFLLGGPCIDVGGAFERLLRRDFPRTSSQIQMRCFAVGKGSVVRHGGSEGLLCVGVE